MSGPTRACLFPERDDNLTGVRNLLVGKYRGGAGGGTAASHVALTREDEIHIRL